MCKRLDCVKANGDPVTYEDGAVLQASNFDTHIRFEHDSPEGRICEDGYACLAPDCPCPPNYQPAPPPPPEIEPKNDASSFHFFETLLDEENGHPSSKKFYDYLIETGLLHAKKRLDYGKDDDPFSNVRASEEWGIQGWVGAMVRLNDKVRRLQTLATKGTLANEAAIDSFMDIACYALISRVLYEQDVSENS